MNVTEELTKHIDKQISEVPERVLETILDNVPSDSYVGVSLRSDDSQALKQRLSQLDYRDMALYAERVIHSANALSESALGHIPHAEGLLKVIDATAEIVHNSDVDEDMATQDFYQKLSSVAQVLPGVASDGSPLAMEKLYATDPGKAEGNPVLDMARDELANPNLEESEREYWESRVKEQLPHLRDRTEIFPDDIHDPASMEAIDAVEAGNAALGKASGQLLNTLYGSNRAPAPEQTTLTATMDSYEAAEPVDAVTPDYVADDRVV